MTESDASSVAAVLAGEVEAFQRLVERHQGRLFAIILRLVDDPQIAEELAQETFVKAYTSLAGFRGKAEFGTWLVQIGLHAARDHLRRERRSRRRQVVSLEQWREGRADGEDPPDPRVAADPAARVAGGELAHILRAGLRRLPPAYREVLVLRHLAEWSFAEIAAHTGDSVGTLKVRAHRARGMLKELLGDMGWTPEDSGRAEEARNAALD